jgi:hypothetical protein
MASAARTAAAASVQADQARTAVQADQPNAGRLAAAKQIRKAVLSRIHVLPRSARRRGGALLRPQPRGRH